MMVLVSLFVSFFKIGAFSFGGGYAMIPLIEKEIIERHSYLTMTQFSDIIAIAEMTPGPISVNAATFVGYKVAGLLGSIICTIGVVMPSFIVILLLARFFISYQQHPMLRAIFRGIRPMVIALVLAAAYVIGKISFIDGPSIVIGFIIFFLVYRKKLHPVLAVSLAGVLGIILY
jgi:chromate transporter